MALPKNPNRRKTYYKVTNKRENHHGLQYHDGLVIDHKPFNSNPTASCIEVGIYFSTKEYIHRFFGHGCWIRPVKIPKDAKVIADPSGDKYRTDRLFFGPRKGFGWYFDSLFDRRTFPENDYWIFIWYCSDYFNKWFNKELFPRDEYWALATYCQDNFDKWFDKSTFPKDEYWRLVQFCPNHFDKWFDKSTFPEKEYWKLAQRYPSRFSEWFDKSTFPKSEYWALVQYCPDHFDEWFDKKLFPKNEYWRLGIYCQKYHNKWECWNTGKLLDTCKMLLYRILLRTP